ncbi:MAG: exo-alpha-sialidase [Verrucomicrobiota bacterium]
MKIAPNFLIACALLTALISAPTQAAEHGHGPTKQRVGVHSLDVYADGNTLHLLLADYQADGKPVLMYQRSADGGKTWATPVRADGGSTAPSTPHRGNDAQIAAIGDKLVAVWMTKGTGLFNSGPMVTALSHDGGKSWKPGPNPADDGLTTGHSFSDICADSSGAFHLAWLDNRDGRQGLRYARSVDGGVSWQKNQTLKTDTCECCWNKLAPGPAGPLVLFRDKQPRDMAILSSPNGGSKWNKQATVGKFSWDFNGCPHVGGGLATEAKGKDTLIHSVVWTGKAEKSGTYHLASRNNGRSWSKPQRLGSSSARRGDIAAGPKGVAMVWEESGDGETAIVIAKSTDSGKTWSQPARIDEASLSAAYPRVIATADGFRVFWTETGAEERGSWKSVAK